MTWSDFETRLFEMITDLPSRTVLIIGARDDQGKQGSPSYSSLALMLCMEEMLTS